MEFEKVLQLRQSTQKYLPKQISDDHLQALLDVANRVPVGSKLYKDIHLTVVQNQEILYDSPMVIFVSHRKQELQPGIEWANVASVVNEMHLTATNMGLGSVYMWRFGNHAYDNGT